ncbi:MAG: ABC transporter permease [Bacteroidaceae bacterium]|nr:ABC transporter permease [Bacteroidaceae bacterium]
MITKLLHQIWNERKQNAWLFFELFIVSIFMWLAIDPLFNLVIRDNIAKGYNSDNIYSIYFSHHNKRSPKYKAEFDNATTISENYMQILNFVENMPEIENYGISKGNFPGSDFSGKWDFTVSGEMRADGKEIKKEICYYINVQTTKSNYYKTFEIKDAATGEIYKETKDNNGGCYVSKSLAKKLFDTESAIGKRINMDKMQRSFTVSGVFEDVQSVIYSEPGELMIINQEFTTPNNNYTATDYVIHIKLKKGVDTHLFKKKIENEIMPQLSIGNIYCKNFISHEEMKHLYEDVYGIKNKYRQNFIISAFAILCTILGIIGTFWIRAVARRQEIGIMQSVGATRGTIVGQFVIEAVILATFAFALTMPLILHKIHTMGFAEPLTTFMEYKPIGETALWCNKPVPHFIIVSAISYVLITITCIIGAAIPVAVTIKREPVEALREE